MPKTYIYSTLWCETHTKFGISYSKKGNLASKNSWAPVKSKLFAMHQTISWVHVVPRNIIKFYNVIYNNVSEIGKTLIKFLIYK